MFILGNGEIKCESRFHSYKLYDRDSSCFPSVQGEPKSLVSFVLVSVWDSPMTKERLFLF